MNNLGIEEFALHFDADPQSFSEKCKALISSLDFRYQNIEGEQLESLILSILKRIDEDKQIIGAKDRTEAWSKGWQENLDQFLANTDSIESLVPKFIRPNQAIRLNSKYILPVDSEFELNFVKVYRQWFLEEYFSDVDNIFEFGCGTGFNLIAASEIFPDKKLYGSDFVDSAVNLVNATAKKYNIELNGELFNMLEPRSDYKIPKCSGVFTFGSLEQLASDLEPMINFLLDSSPDIIVHTEPAIELYDDSKLNDYLAIKFQGNRGYSAGLLPLLEGLEKQGKIKLIKVKRLFFGSLYMEGYNTFVWKKVK
jgi:SAM-dependent methyltransferase